jgi:hypothetical protein
MRGKKTDQFNNNQKKDEEKNRNIKISKMQYFLINRFRNVSKKISKNGERVDRSRSVSIFVTVKLHLRRCPIRSFQGWFCCERDRLKKRVEFDDVLFSG